MTAYLCIKLSIIHPSYFPLFSPSFSLFPLAFSSSSTCSAFTPLLLLSFLYPFPLSCIWSLSHIFPSNSFFLSIAPPLLLLFHSFLSFFSTWLPPLLPLLAYSILVDLSSHLPSLYSSGLEGLNSKCHLSSGVNKSGDLKGRRKKNWCLILAVFLPLPSTFLGNFTDTNGKNINFAVLLRGWGNGGMREGQQPSGCSLPLQGCGVEVCKCIWTLVHLGYFPEIWSAWNSMHCIAIAHLYIFAKIIS